MNLKITWCWMLIFILSGMDALNAEEKNLSVSKDAWNVGIAELQGEGGALSESAAVLIPRIIRNEIEDADAHRLSRTEREALAARLKEEKIRQARLTVEEKYEARDKFLFLFGAQNSNVRRAEEEIKKARENLIYWEEYSESNATTPEMLKIKFASPEEGGSIWNVGSSDPDFFREKKNLDVLLGGRIVRVGDYYGIRIIAWKESGRTILWEGAGGESELGELARQAGAAARKLVLGRSWTGLTVNAVPANASIRVNGNFEGVGYWSDMNLNPGEIKIEVSAPGYSLQLITENLEDGTPQEINVTLDKAEQPQVLIRSTPANAAVRLGSLWLGTTPLLVNIPDRVMSLKLEKEGYRSRFIPLTPESESLTVELVENLQDSVEALKEARRKLYNSIGLFSFSLAPTVILIGLSNSYRGQVQLSSAAENKQDLVNAFNVTTGMMWGSLALNAGLLTFVIIRLAKYLKAAERVVD